METTINQLFETISNRLNGGSLNYCASFKLWTCDQVAGHPLDQILTKVIGEGVVIGGTESSNATEVHEELSYALAYQGDDGAHPCPTYLKSDQYGHDVRQALMEIDALINGADRIISFWLKAGHPFYPVFWDFAFSIEKQGQVFVLIGSSSD
jgi:hypothetical protein